MSHGRLRDQLKALNAQHTELKQRHDELAKSKRLLLLRNALLQAWCDYMSFMQLILAVKEPESEAGSARFTQLLQTEVQLLEQLSSSNSSPRGCQQALEQLLTPEPRTISPATNPLAVLYRYMGMPLLEQAHTMTTNDFATLLQQTVQTVSIKLHQLECVTPRQRDGILDQLEADWDRWFHALISLVMVGRQSIVGNAATFNLQTLQDEPAASERHQQKQAAAVLPLLNLSQQQQEILTASLQLYTDLHPVIYQERHYINSQMAALETPEATTTSSCDAGGAGSAISSQVPDLPSRQAQLQMQQELTTRLDLLLNKEYKLRFASMGMFTGALTYEQLSRLAVMSWPYPPRVLFFAASVSQQQGEAGFRLAD